MEESALDLDRLGGLLLSIMSRMDKKTLDGITPADLSRLQETVLETIGVAPGGISAVQQEILAVLLQAALQAARERQGREG